ncbi:MAG: hypothetical protein MR704_09505 [Clostridia bacterium]|nr:hypothetical protein [Clostridia bacterium]
MKKEKIQKSDNLLLFLGGLAAKKAKNYRWEGCWAQIAMICSRPPPCPGFRPRSPKVKLTAISENMKRESLHIPNRRLQAFSLI